jgi:hypothetical protein
LNPKDLRNAQNVLMTNLKVSDNSADQGVDGTLTLEYIKTNRV